MITRMPRRSTVSFMKRTKNEKGAAAYSACSEKTDGLVTLPATLVEAIISDMKDLFD